MTDTYILNSTTASITIEIEPYSIDLSTSLTFYGKNALNYWYDLNNNLLLLLSNFSSKKAPLRPIQGQIWFESTENKLKYFDQIWHSVTPQRPDLSMYVTIHDDTMQGNLILDPQPQNAKSIIPRVYVDTQLANCTYGDENGVSWVKHTDTNYVIISLSATKSGQTVTLPFEMSDTSYSILATSNETTNQKYDGYHWVVYNKTTTDFQVKFYNSVQTLAIIITGFAK